MGRAFQESVTGKEFEYKRIDKGLQRELNKKSEEKRVGLDRTKL